MRRDGIGRRGASTFGCLLSLVFFLAAIYYGSQVGAIYWRHYSFMDRVRIAARFAANQSDVAIRNQLRSAIDEIGVPPEARRNLQIRRAPSRRVIIIDTRYEETLNLPFVNTHTIVFRPHVETRY